MFKQGMQGISYTPDDYYDNEHPLISVWRAWWAAIPSMTSGRHKGPNFPSESWCALVLFILAPTTFPNHDIVARKDEALIMVQDGQGDLPIHCFFHCWFLQWLRGGDKPADIIGNPDTDNKQVAMDEQAIEISSCRWIQKVDWRWRWNENEPQAWELEWKQMRANESVTLAASYRIFSWNEMQQRDMSERAKHRYLYGTWGLEAAHEWLRKIASDISFRCGRRLNKMNDNLYKIR